MRESNRTRQIEGELRIEGDRCSSCLLHPFMDKDDTRSKTSDSRTGEDLAQGRRERYNRGVEELQAKEMTGAASSDANSH